MDRAVTLRRLHAAQQSFYAGAGDGPLREVLSEDIAWHVPGASDIAGTTVGIDPVLEYFARRRELGRAGLGPRPDPASLRALDDDLRSGAWDARHGALRHTASIDAGYRLVTTDL